ncbi:GbsR/MarR family transcriptional regulator [Capnocytophaga catalasegens]|uniref:Transcriptional regulator n=1 Tax=Capnocytophaga catalasegens TaxID=1004260 RepID=A0AAV5AT42_9FLAO|nr:hypothetical protein [Capnocytophaga catalasegens]GIZ15969.1 hypothetical protein RCZ03_19690 [Capnocytophaga catalasegens]GJM50456.1 hypothetical protein RCZ15_14290 [Capnocytophaga catalasegens]GJM53951.1 hypothetical protein RCZ16_22670 [Capnocytophaga catalasegens]
MIDTIDQKLLQDLINMYIKYAGFSPIAAKICAYLKFDFSGEGVTFDQLIEALGVSKGSVSLNLRQLIDKEIIVEIKKFDNRKTYYTYNHNYILLWFEEMIKKLEYMSDISNRITEMAQIEGKIDERTLHIKRIHQSFLEESIIRFKRTLTKIEQI